MAGGTRANDIGTTFCWSPAAGSLQPTMYGGSRRTLTSRVKVATTQLN